MFKRAIIYGLLSVVILIGVNIQTKKVERDFYQKLSSRCKKDMRSGWFHLNAVKEIFLNRCEDHVIGITFNNLTTDSKVVFSIK